MNRPENSPFDLLLGMAARSRSAISGEDAVLSRSPEAHWTGVGFSIGSVRFVAPLGQVTEILTGVGLTRLPMVQSWVKGVANVRGRLLPVMDLTEFLSGELPIAGRRQRVLVVEIDETYCGLMVDEAHGLKHFVLDDYHPETPDVQDSVRQYTAGHYTAHDDQWLVFDMGKLVTGRRFLDAGAA